MSGTATEGWVRVTRRRRCPICDHPDWCGISEDGKLVHCMRISEGAWKATPAGGWLHRMEDHPGGSPVMPRTAPPRKPYLPVSRLQEMLDRAKAKTRGADLERLAARLGLSAPPLVRLEASVYGPGTWAFPMRDGRGRLAGLRLRAEAGGYWCVAGSHQGLFIPQRLPPRGLLLAVEGPTDTAALLACGFAAVGRPSCQGCHRPVLRLCAGRDLVIVADHDEPKTRPDATVWFPGLEGAEKLARECYAHARTVKVIQPRRGKDIRQWYALEAGRDRPAILRAQISTAPLWRP